MTQGRDENRAETASLLAHEAGHVFWEFAHDAVFVMDDEQFVDANLASLRLFGCQQRDQLLGQTPVRFSPAIQPDGQSSTEAARQRIAGALGGTPQLFEWRHCRLDGTEFDAEVSLNGFHLGGRSLIVAVVRDITERKRAEAAVRRSEKKYRGLVETTDTGFAILDRDGRVRDANAEYVRLTGHQRLDDIRGRAVTEWTAAADREHNARALRRCLDDGSIRNLELSYAHPDGHLLYLEVNATVIHTDNGDEIVSLCRDITKRKEEQAQLEMFKRSIEVHRDAAYWLDHTNHLVYVNQAAARDLGYERDDLLGRPVQDVNPRATPERLQALWDGLHREGASFQRSIHCRKDGSVFPVEVMTVLVRFDGQDYACGFARDVAERERAESALHEANARLVDQDRRKDEFLAMLSHELRNPLAPIRNSLYILDRAAPGSEQARRAREVIERQTAHITRLIDGLLDVTRISRGKVHLQRERLDLCALVRGTIDDHRSLFVQSGVELDVHIADDLLWMNADGTRLAQVIGNLLQNAAKFTGRGGTTSVVVEKNAAAGLAVFQVRDTGIGISPEILPHLFEPFIQADRTLDRSRGGLGLGLALVKGVVELHGGTVEAKSDGVGAGAKFTVRLPLEQRAAEAEPAGVTRLGCGF